jgi:hypothetical protein
VEDTARATIRFISPAPLTRPTSTEQRNPNEYRPAWASCPRRLYVRTPHASTVAHADNVGPPHAASSVGRHGSELADADFRLRGAWVRNDALAAGDRNTVRAEFRGVTGSGSQARPLSRLGREIR